MFQPTSKDLTREVSDKTRRFIGVLCLLFSCTVFYMTYVGNDEISFILSMVVGIPLFLVSLSLLFGKASKGQGLFSSYSLYFISIIILSASVIVFLTSGKISGIAILMGLGCFYLGKKRGKSKT